MKTSVIKGYFREYKDAYEAVGARFLRTRKFSIQRSSEAKAHPWVLIYYGNFV